MRPCALALLTKILGLTLLASAQVKTEIPPVVPGAKPVTVERIKIHGTALEGNLEGDSPDRCTQSAGVPKGGGAEQERNASSRSPTGAPPGVAQMGYSDPPGLNILIQDILFEKSPKP